MSDQRKKIIFLMPSLAGGGAEKIASILLPYLNREFDLLLLLLENRQVYNIPKQVEVHTFSSPLNNPQSHLIRIPWHFFSLLWMVHRHKPDIVLSFMEQANVLNLSISLCIGKHKAVISQRVMRSNQYKGKGLLGRVILQVSNWLYPKADHIITISEGIRKSLLNEINIKEENISTIYNPIDSESLSRQVKENYNPPINDDYILHVGRIRIAHKGQDILLEAFQILHESHPDLHLIMVGDGPDRKLIENKIRSLGLSDCVLLTGWQNNVACFMAHARLLVLSSRYEGFGNVLVEAMSVGCPVVATDCPSGPKEILGENKYGLLVPVENSHAIADAMARLVSDKTIHSYYQKQAIVRSHDFSLDKIGNEYVNLLKSI